MSTFPFNMLPFAGGNWQTIDTNWWSPNITMNFAGNAGIEREVNEDVASYGTQIGRLNEIVLALAAAAPGAIDASADAKGALKKLKVAQADIERIKKRRQISALDRARDALTELEKADQDAYGRLVRSLKPDKLSGRG
jgi:hypothetical protein